MLDCLFCYPDKENSLDLLHSQHPEFYLSQLINDGTNKWFVCTNCSGVFCFDKMQQSWKVSPGTYTKFKDQGLIKDKLLD